MSSMAMDEAANWIARLQSGDYTKAEAAAFRDWIEASPQNALAFEFATATWDMIGASAERPVEANADAAPRPARLGRRAVLTGGIAAGVLAIGGTLALQPAFAQTYETGVGEVRDLTLPDGSRLKLDVCSRLSLTMTRKSRELTLHAGRASLTVAADASRPAALAVGGCKVSGQHCVVDLARPDESQASVTVVEGAARVSGTLDKAGQAVVLTAGRRLSEGAGGSLSVDQPEMGRITAWQDGFVDFDDEELASVAARMNGYSRTPIVVDPAASRLRLSGRSEGRDLDGFIRSVEVLLPVSARREGGRIYIAPKA